MEKEYLMDYDKLIKKYHKQLKKAKITPKNRKDIKAFIANYSIEKNLTKPSILKHLKTLIQLAEVLGTDFREVMNNPTAINQLLCDLKSINIAKKHKVFGEKKPKKTVRHYSEASIYEFRKELKVFFKWLNNGEPPPCTKKLKLGPKPQKQILASQLLTPEDVHKLISLAETIKLKAMIAVHWESGCRASEFITLRIRDVTFDELGAKISVNGKTGPRNVRLIESVPYLTQWCSSHPERENNDAYLWITEEIEKDEDKKTFCDRYIRKVRKIAKQAEINKRIYFHLFRHSITTQRIREGVPEKVLQRQMGWTNTSKMLARYTHLVDEDTDNALAKVYGIKNSKKDEKRKICPRCKKINPPYNKEACGFCGSPFDISACNTMENRLKYEKIGTHLLDRLLQKKSVQRMVKNLITKGEVSLEELKTS